MPKPDTIISQTSLLDHEITIWIAHKASELEAGRAKFCALNAIRFLRYANDILLTLPIVSSFCALNATEEAVAAFISAAKRTGSRDKAKQLNLHNHHSKALVSVYAQRCSKILEQGSLALALHQGRDNLALRVPSELDYYYADLHLGSFQVHPNTNTNIEELIPLGDMPSHAELESEISRVAEARNSLLYATDQGYPSGFTDPKFILDREIKLSFGLIWAAIDIYRNPNENSQFIDEVLADMALLDTNRLAKPRIG